MTDSMRKESVEEKEGEEYDDGVKRDIGKLADRLVELGREGIVIERKILEWKAAEKKDNSAPKTKAS